MSHLKTAASFAALGVEPAFVAALSRLGITCPSEIQNQTLPRLLKHSETKSQAETHDSQSFVIAAETGSGKTLCYMLPIMQYALSRSLSSRANAAPLGVVTVPSKVLVEQVRAQFATISVASEKCSSPLGKFDLVTSLDDAFGSQGTCAQKVLVATAKRVEQQVLPLIRRGVIPQIFAFDEADALMADAGSLKSVRKVVTEIAKQQQRGSEASVLFLGATVGREQSKRGVLAYAQSFTKNVTLIESTMRHHTPKLLEEQFVGVQKTGEAAEDHAIRDQALVDAIKSEQEAGKLRLGLVFVPNTEEAERVFALLRGSKQLNHENDSVKVAEYHLGVKDPALRENALFEALRAGRQQVEHSHYQPLLLVCTDILARGIDIPSVTHVFQYRVARDVGLYLHRVGRTARAGASGKSIAIYTEPDEYPFVFALKMSAQGQHVRHPYSVLSELEPELAQRLPSRLVYSWSFSGNTAEVLNPHDSEKADLSTMLRRGGSSGAWLKSYTLLKKYAQTLSSNSTTNFDLLETKTA